MAVGRVRMLAKRRRHAGQERSSLARLATLSSDSIVLIEPEASSNSRQCQTIKTETEERRQATLTEPVLNALVAKAVLATQPHNLRVARMHGRKVVAADEALAAGFRNVKGLAVCLRLRIFNL